ncbi:hypothetical protein ACT3UJ_06245, partial [Halomonas sp. 86]
EKSMQFDLYCDAEVVAECSYSGTSTHYPVRYQAGQVSSASEILGLLKKPSLAWVQEQVKIGKRLAYCELKAVRLYRHGQYLLGGYLTDQASAIQWVKPVKNPAERANVEYLMREFTHKAREASYMSHLTYQSALMLSLMLVEGDHGLMVDYNGTAPERLLKQSPQV